MQVCGGALQCPHAVLMRPDAPWILHAAGGPLAWAGGDGSSRPYYPQRRFDFLNMPASGSCEDPVDYAALQLLLGALCNDM